MFKQKKLSRGARFGLAVASFVLGILLFVSAIATAVVANVRIVTSEENISGVIREMISAPGRVHNRVVVQPGEGSLRIAPRTRTYQMPRREEPGDVAADLTAELIDMFYDELSNQFDEEMPVTKEEFAQLINESTAKDYVADKTAALITDYFNDEVTTTFEPEEIVQLINENAALIESITGQPIPDDIAQQVAVAFDENEIIIKVEAEGLAGFMTLLDEDGTGIAGMLSGNAESGFDVRSMLNTMRDATSVGNLILGVVICLVLIAAIILVNCHQLARGLRRAGYPLIFAGSIHFVLNATIGFLSNILNTLFADDPSLGPIAMLIPKLIRYILSKTAVISIVILSVGCILFVGGIVLGIVLRPKKSPVSVPTTPETEELAAALVDETPVEVVLEAAEEEETEETEEEIVTEEEPIAEETAEEDAAPVGE